MSNLDRKASGKFWSYEVHADREGRKNKLTKQCDEILLCTSDASLDQY